METTISTFELIEFSGILIAMIVSVILINRNLKKGYKLYTDNKMEVLNTRVVAIEKEIGDDKKANIREHDQLRELFKKIDVKLDRLIERKVG